MPTLDWIGKKAVVNHHREVPYRLLKGDATLSVGDAGSGNLLVQGDIALVNPLSQRLAKLLQGGRLAGVQALLQAFGLIHVLNLP